MKRFQRNTALSLSLSLFPRVLLHDGGKNNKKTTDRFIDRSQYGVLNFDGEPPSDPTKASAGGVNSIAMKMLGKGAARASVRDGDEADY